jgi:zinc-finger of transposase IS204/IS1001/IS1096/IS1165
MRDTNLLQLALGPTPPWTVTRSDCDLDAKRLDIQVDFAPGSRFPCPSCGAADFPAYDSERTSWRQPNFFQHQAYLNARVPRIRCDKCGVRQANMSIGIQKGPPIGAQKGPFRDGAGTIFRREVASALVPAEAARRDDCLEFSEIEVRDRLQRLGEGAVLQALRQCFQPGGILRLQCGQHGDRVAPLFGATAVIQGATCSDRRTPAARAARQRACRSASVMGRSPIDLRGMVHSEA